jgi:hypothetical protein
VKPDNAQRESSGFRDRFGAERDLFGAVHVGRTGSLGVIALASIVLSACAYRLPVSNAPAQWHLLIVATSPERYVVRVHADHVAEFPVASDGRVTIDVPRLPRACSTYLFNRIRISGGLQPLTEKSVHLIDSGNLKTRLSLGEIAKLPSDASGYHILSLQK